MQTYQVHHLKRKEGTQQDYNMSNVSVSGC